MSKILSMVVCVFVIFGGLQFRPLLAATSIATQEPMGIPSDTVDKTIPEDDNDNKTKDTQASKLETQWYNFKKELGKSPLKFGPSYDNKGAQIRIESQF